MRILTLTLLSLALAACASVPPAPTPSAPAPTLAGPAPSRAAGLLRAAGAATAPTIAEAQAILGPADIARTDGAGAMLTYRLETCALLLVFAADSANTLRLADAHASARAPSAPAPSLDVCGAEADARTQRQ